MKLKKWLGTLLLSTIATTAMAVDNVAKEELTPPPAEGALAADQIPPISMIGKPPATVPAAPSAPTTPATPATTTTISAPPPSP